MRSFLSKCLFYLNLNLLMAFSAGAGAEILSESGCPETAASPVTLSAETTDLNFAEASHILIDRTGDADYATVRRRMEDAFEPNCTDFFEAVADNAALWIRIPVDRPRGAPEDWVIAFNDPEIGQLGVFQTYPDGWIEARHSGREVDPETREFASLKPAVTAHLPGDGTSNLYVRVAGTVAPYLTATITPERDFFQSENLDLVILTGIIGFLCAMLIVNLVLYLRSRLSHFAWYSLYLISMIAGILVYDGILYRLTDIAWSTYPGGVTDDLIAVVSALALFQFGRLLLKLPETAPVADRTVKSIIAVILVTGIAQLVDSTVSVFLFQLSTLTAGMFLLAMSVYFARRGSTPATLFAISFVCVLGGYALDLLFFYLPNSTFPGTETFPALYRYLENWSFHTGVILETSLISLALTYFIREMDEERDRARSEADRRLREAETMRDDYEEKLQTAERDATARTADAAATGSIDPRSADEQFVQTAIRIINEHLTDDALEVSFLADRLAVSEQTLRRRLRNAVGLTPVAFIRRQRLVHARYMLENGVHSSVGEVANAVGIYSASRFSRQYREAFGVSPREVMRRRAEPDGGGDIGGPLPVTDPEK